MSDRVPIPVFVGSITPWNGTRLPMGTFEFGATITELVPTLLEVSGEIVTVSVHDAAAAGTTQSVTIAAGSQVPATIALGTPLEIAAGGGVWVSCSEAASSTGFGLSGFVTALVGGSGVVAAGALTTLARVKAHAGITDSTIDTEAAQLILDVSSRFEQHCGRTLAQQTFTSELHQPSGDWTSVILREYPADVTTVVEGDTTLAGTDWRLRGERELIRLESTTASRKWASGFVQVTYDGGYASGSIPRDLMLAADMQVRAELAKWGDHGDRLGVVSATAQAGAALEMAQPVQGFLPEVREMLRPYVRKF